MNDYINKLSAQFILNILCHMDKRSQSAKSAAEYLFFVYPHYRLPSKGKTKNSITAHIAELEKLCKKWKNSKPPIEYRKIQTLHKTLGLNESEIQLITFFYTISFDDVLEKFFRQFVDLNNVSPVRKLASILQMKQSDIAKSLQKKSSIHSMGIAEINDSAYRVSGCDYVELSPMFVQWVESFSEHSITEFMFGTPLKAALSSVHYPHLIKEREQLCLFLKKARKNTEKHGVNILLYGPPGTGKTEFSKMIAKSIKADLYAVGEVDDDKGEMSRGDRLKQLNLANHLLKENNKALLLFDEMEDLLDCGYGRLKNSKIFMNRLLENNRVPTIWISNDIDSFDPAFLRRMGFIVELKSPPAKHRETLWRKMLREEKVNLPPHEVRAIAQNFDDAPALARNAICEAKTFGGGVHEITRSLNTMRRALGGKTKQHFHMQASNQNDEFNISLSVTDTNLGDLTERLQQDINHIYLSMCLYGPSGTGKSAYAKYLAYQLGLEPRYVKCSDIVSCYVGETEKNISRTFEEALQNKEFLIFDEADSFLRSRERAQRSWEVSAVNEMLTCMEYHPYPFVCTTNLMSEIDSAALRRFMFKVKFDYMGVDQVNLAFKKFFKQEPPNKSREIEFLTPADFSVVQKKAIVLGFDKDPYKLSEMLAQESKAKGLQKNTIGFQSSGL